MTVSVSIQETTITPAKGGCVVHLNISDKPIDVSDASFGLTLRVLLVGTTPAKLADIQKAALEEVVEALKPLMSGLYP